MNRSESVRTLLLALGGFLLICGIACYFTAMDAAQKTDWTKAGRYDHQNGIGVTEVFEKGVTVEATGEFLPLNDRGRAYYLDGWVKAEAADPKWVRKEKP